MAADGPSAASSTLSRRRRRSAAAAGVWAIGVLLVIAPPSRAQEGGRAGPSTQACPGDNGGITLPPGFCATVFADNIGHARHLVAAPNGVVYVNTRTGKFYGEESQPDVGAQPALDITDAPENDFFPDTKKRGENKNA